MKLFEGGPPGDDMLGRHSWIYRNPTHTTFTYCRPCTGSYLDLDRCGDLEACVSGCRGVVNYLFHKDHPRMMGSDLTQLDPVQ